MRWRFLPTTFSNRWLFLIFVMFSSSQTMETTPVTVLDSDVIKVKSDVDKDRLQATARLHDVIVQLPFVKHKVAPVTTLESGDVRVNVDASFNVGSVLSLNDAEQMMTCSVYIVVEWRDISLVWNPRDYNNVSMIEMSPGSIWMPTLMLINSRDPVNIMSYVTGLSVNSNGTVKALIYYKTATLCTMELSQFPYDTQQCSLIVESPSACCRINVKLDLMDQTEAVSLIVQSDWELVSVNLVVLSGSDLPSMQLELRRRTVYFTVCLVLPMVLTSYMNTLVFLLPVQCGERFSFLVTIFVSTSLFISFFKDVMPRGLITVPATMKLLVGVLVESLLVLLATVLVVWRHHSQETAAKDPSPSPHPVSSLRQSSKPCQEGTVSDGMNGEEKSQPQIEAFAMVSTAGNTERPASRMPGRQHLWDAQKLDRIFFALGFVSNTVFLLGLFFISFF
ncbi:hypothetical protein ACOMHN_065962 [Nucella lapillus]